jgi:hypothetical protein
MVQPTGAGYRARDCRAPGQAVLELEASRQRHGPGCVPEPEHHSSLLLVEDDPLLSATLARALYDYGFQVTIARDIDEAESAIAAALRDKAESADASLLARPLSPDRLEWEHIQRVLAEHKGNVTRDRAGPGNALPHPAAQTGQAGPARALRPRLTFALPGGRGLAPPRSRPCWAHKKKGSSPGTASPISAPSPEGAEEVDCAFVVRFGAPPFTYVCSWTAGFR